MQDFDNVLFTVTVLVALVGIQISNAQFPTECLNDTANIQAKRCCPRDCGSVDGRGICGSINLPADLDKSSVRDAWPYYFNHVCVCNHNFSGYDCGRCKYGHYGVSCNDSKVVERRPISKYSPQEWKEYLKILELTKTYDSRYSVFLNEPTPYADPLQLPQTTITLYNLFVWKHHYSAKDSENKG